MKKITMKLVVLLPLVFVSGCATGLNQVLTKNGAVTWKDGEIVRLEEYTSDQTKKLDKILGDKKIITGNTGLDIAGGPRVASTSVLDETNQLIVNNGGSNTGTLQDLIPTATQASIYGGAAIAVQSLVNEGNEAVADINRDSNIQAAKSIRPPVTVIRNTNNDGNNVARVGNVTTRAIQETELTVTAVNQNVNQNVVDVDTQMGCHTGCQIPMD